MVYRVRDKLIITESNKFLELSLFFGFTKVKRVDNCNRYVY